jgi:DNA polymerase-1
MLTISDMIDEVREIPAGTHNVSRINSIADLYKPQRQDSKTPTFALTYQGTWKTIVGQGFAVKVAKQIEKRYHELYAVSDQWVAAKLDQASIDGYITAAFGLRVRTPLLAQVIRGNSKTPHEAEAEGRTAGNALGQSWCLLNSRAWVEFMQKVRSNPDMRLKIRPCAQIHDAGYALIPDDIEVLQYVNEHLVEAVFWQDHPDIAHPDVQLGGELSVFWPSWEHEAVIPNSASVDAIYAVIENHTKKLQAKGVI